MGDCLLASSHVFPWVKVFRIIPEFGILRLENLKMLNSADENNIFDLVSVNIKVLDHLTWIFF